VTRALIFGLVFGGVGAICAWFALHLRRRHRREIAPLIETTGRVIRIEESDVDGQRMYQPVVELVLGDQAYAIVDTTFHGTAAWQPGDAHAVFYDPAKPLDARLSRETGSLFGAQMAGLLGVVFLAIGAVALLACALGEDSALGAFVRDALA
jgi:hypothetical protein